MKTAYIIGAGPVGLVTGLELIKKNFKVEIYERNNIVGGMCRTWKWSNYLVDTGPHIFHTPNKDLANYWEKEFGDLFVKGDFWCKNVSGSNFDKYWDYPISWESISRYPIKLKKTILEELRKIDSEDKAKAKNYLEYMLGEVGPTLTKLFYTTYPEKIWGIKTKSMTPEWAPKRVEFRNKVTPFYDKQWNAVGKYGTGCIYERIKDQILKLGGKFHFNNELQSMSYKNNQIQELNFSKDLTIKILKGDVIISSLPITATAKMLGYKSKLKFRGIRSVYLSYKKKEILPKNIHWLYYGDKDILFNRVTEPKKLSKYVAPKNSTYITAEITFSRNDKIHKLNEEKLINIVSKQIEKVGLAKKSDFLEGSSNIEPFVYPIMYSGYQEDLAKTKSFIEKFDKLYSIGTGGDYNYADSQILFQKAFDTAEVITNKNSKFNQTVREIKTSKLNKNIEFNNISIGDNHPAFIIAEAGLNHNGSVKLAKELIYEAKKSGCNAIKFQSYLPNSRISSKFKSVNYAETVNNENENLNQMFNRLSLSFKQQKEIFDYAKKINIEIFSTPFDFESVDFLSSLGVNIFKIASMDLVNLPLIEYTARTNKIIIISTGMSTLGQIEDAVETVKKTGNDNLVILHCNSSYPAAPEDMNLRLIKTLKHNFNIPIGLSDHTLGVLVSQTAIAIGANVIERHFTLDKSFEGPDHILSSEPHEMKNLVNISKKIPKIIGDGMKTIKPTEYETINTQRKCLYAKKDIKKGSLINKNSIAIKGPGGGILPKYLDIVIGRKAKKSIKKDFPITWENI